MTTFKEEILSILYDNIHCWGGEISGYEETRDTITESIEKSLDKVEQDYKSELNNWGKTQPMKDMYPKQMETLERVRKELLK